MDIICARCGKHFSSIEDAREHRGHCKETSEGEAIHWIPAPNSKVTPEEWESLMKLINKKREKISNYKIQNWLMALVFIFALCVTGLGVSIFVGSFIPLWLMFGFAFIYAIEKWLYYFTRKHRVL